MHVSEFSSCDAMFATRKCRWAREIPFPDRVYGGSNCRHVSSRKFHLNEPKMQLAKIRESRRVSKCRYVHRALVASTQPLPVPVIAPKGQSLPLTIVSSRSDPNDHVTENRSPPADAINDLVIFNLTTRTLKQGLYPSQNDRNANGNERICSGLFMPEHVFNKQVNVTYDLFDVASAPPPPHHFYWFKNWIINMQKTSLNRFSRNDIMFWDCL